LDDGIGVGNGCSAHSVINDIEALTFRVERDVLRLGKRMIINAEAAEHPNNVLLFGPHSSEDIGAPTARGMVLAVYRTFMASWENQLLRWFFDKWSSLVFSVRRSNRQSVVNEGFIH
jgi:hypothetical protein